MDIRRPRLRGTFAVASLEDVTRSKQAAGRDKDARVLPLLRRMLAEGVQLER